MRMFERPDRFFILLALACLATWFARSPAAAGSQAPFQAGVAARITLTPTADPLVVTVNYVGTGQGNQLGRFKLEAEYLLNLANLDKFILQGRSFTGVSYTFTAANGDKLFGNCDGHTIPTATPGVAAFVTDGTFTGGTGRFKNATGSYLVTGQVNIISGAVIASITGTLSSPGANGI